MIKYVIFDLVGVVLNDIWEEHYNYLSKTLQMSMRRIEAVINPGYEEMEVGSLDIKTFLRRVAKEFNATQKSLLWREAVGIWMHPDKRIIKLMKKLRKRFTLVLLTNMSRSDYFFDSKLFDKKLFHKRFLSCYLHVRKPDRRIYEITLKRLEANPEETVFIDNAKSNVEAAKALGMNTILYTSYGKLVADLMGLDLL